jgi:hypothetical protein
MALTNWKFYYIIPGKLHAARYRHTGRGTDLVLGPSFMLSRGPPGGHLNSIGCVRVETLDPILRAALGMRTKKI